MQEAPRKSGSLFSKSAKAAANVTANNLIPAGFTTAHGSVYAYVDEKASTQRFKVANGPGQGELHAPQMCVFIEQIEATPRNDFDFYWAGYTYKDGSITKFKIVESPDELPPGKQLKLFRPERDGKTKDILNASFTPKPGLVVVEVANHERGAHKGHAVAEIIPTKERVLNRMIEAGKQFGRDESYFNEVATALKGQGMKRG